MTIVFELHFRYFFLGLNLGAKRYLYILSSGHNCIFTSLLILSISFSINLVKIELGDIFGGELAEGKYLVGLGREDLVV